MSKKQYIFFCENSESEIYTIAILLFNKVYVRKKRETEYIYLLFKFKWTLFKFGAMINVQMITASASWLF